MEAWKQSLTNTVKDLPRTRTAMFFLPLNPSYTIEVFFFLCFTQIPGRSLLYDAFNGDHCQDTAVDKLQEHCWGIQDSYWAEFL